MDAIWLVEWYTAATLPTYPETYFHNESTTATEHHILINKSNTHQSMFEAGQYWNAVSVTTLNATCLTSKKEI